MHTHMNSKAIALATFLVTVVCTACSGDDSKGASSSSGASGTNGTGGTSGTSGTSGTDGGTSDSKSTGSCKGEITDCAVGSLSDAQASDMCSLLLAAIDSPAGTKYECTSGPKSGLFITVNSKEQCVAQRAPASCKVTVGQLIACFKGAKKDACDAFSDSGPCSLLFDPASGCSGT